MRESGSLSLSFLAAAVLVLAFGTPLRALWLRDAAPWWLGYAIWAGAIFLLYLAERSRKAYERARASMEDER
jgi:arginine exporter protein ArgO